MKRLLILIAAAISSASLPLAAQLYYNMEPNSANYVIEQNTGRQAWVNGAHFAVEVPGAVGKALRFDGYSTYIEAQQEHYNLSVSEFTMSMWVAIETYPLGTKDLNEDYWSDMFGTRDERASVKTGWSLRISSRGHYAADVYDINGRNVSAYPGDNAYLPKNEWVHVAATYSVAGQRLILYLNGTEVASTSVSTKMKPGVATILIGKSHRNPTNGLFFLDTFNGIIDEPQFRNQVLSAAQIRAEYQAGRHTTPDLADMGNLYDNNYYRPRLHAMPAKNWTNECHGLVYANGRYHLFSQKNGNSCDLLHIHWGHYSSADLLHWTEEPIAIAPDKSYDIKGCWSGAVFVDDELTGGEPNIIYTGVDFGRATIDLAKPLDADLIRWDKRGIIINGTPGGQGYEDFRDPYFFRNGSDAYIIVGTKQGGIATSTLHHYEGGNWVYKGNFFRGSSAATVGEYNEMCNVTKLPDGRWLFTATPIGGSRGVRTIYWVGHINADGTFAPDEAEPKSFEMDPLSGGGNGLLSPSLYYDDGKLLAIGIVPDRLGQDAYYKIGFAHCMSLPRELSVDAGGNLIQRPYSGVADLHREHFGMADTTITTAVSCEPVSGRMWHATISAPYHKAEATPNAAFGIRFLKNANGSASLYYTPKTNKLRMSATNLSCYIFQDFDVVLPFTPMPGEDVKLDIYFDHSIIDIFVNDRYAASRRIFCKNYNADGLEFITMGTTVVTKADAWVLDEVTHYSPWVDPVKPIDPDPDPQGIFNTREPDTYVRKLIRDGQIIIRTEEAEYNINGKLTDKR